ncbi:MAG: elongation factor 1-beta [Thermoplasmata archaeon]|jgi:translation elongation factor aEF-1 beta|nr:elongation factor 1-beta [Thermoplasmata archaeon]
MGEVLLKYRLTPEDASTDMSQLEAAVRKALPASVGRVSKADIQPFVFGMKVLVVSLIVQDVEGNNDIVEQTLTGLPGVQGADLVDMGRLM